MKILHTSDWHLGQKFLSNDRSEEHRLALDWLVAFIEEEKVDALLVAGDVFDIYNPPNLARELYFRFLRKMVGSGCRHIVITAGNHDSPAMLGASREILQLLDIHVITEASDEVGEEIVELKNEQGELEAVVSAVPFLRDENIRKSIAGQSDMERSEQLKQAIYEHYQQLAKKMAPYKSQKVPLIAMGHLYAKGAETAEKQDNIYIGNIENIEANQFPKIFDYVALGHIHRQQKVGGMKKVRYSGSLIPLSFSEIKDEKVVLLLDFEGKKWKEIREVSVPSFRRLKTIEDTLDKVLVRLAAFAENKRHLPSWVEVVVETDKVIPNLNGLIQQQAKGLDLEVLKIGLKREYNPLEVESAVLDLLSIDHFEVFKKKCESFGAAPAELKELQKTYRELSENLEDILGEGMTV